MNQKQIDKVLSEPYWPPNLQTGQSYVTTHDDNDGDPKSGMLCVQFSVDGDAWIEIIGRGPLRFRMMDGGGKFTKIRNAILLLSEAIRQDGDIGEEKRISKTEKPG